MTDAITIDTFRPLQDSTFTMEPAGEPPIDATLVEVRSVGAAQGGGREPFALLFRARGDRVLPQATYRFGHDDLGQVDIFVVPVGRTADAVDYEAIFV